MAQNIHSLWWWSHYSWSLEQPIMRIQLCLKPKGKKKAMYTCIVVLGVVVCSVCSDADVRVQRSLISVWCKAGSPVISDWLTKGWTANVWAEQTESWTSHPSQGSWAEEPVRRSWLGGRWGSRKKGRRRWPWGRAWGGVARGVSPWQHDCRAVD